jgi:hypothetical protein
MQHLDNLYNLCKEFLRGEQTVEVLQKVFQALNELISYMKTKAGRACFSKKAREMMMGGKAKKLPSYQQKLKEELNLTSASQALETVFWIHELVLGARLLCFNNYVCLFQEDIGSVLASKRGNPFESNSDDEGNEYFDESNYYF